MASFSSSSSSSSSSSRSSTWVVHEDTLLCHSNAEHNNIIIAFDVDHTVIKPASGRVHPKDEHDWTWWHESVPARLRRLVNDEKKKVIFISNQSNCTGAKRHAFQNKMDAVLAQLCIPIQIYVATADNSFRKPSPRIWHVMQEHFNNNRSVKAEQCMYVGDAAGRHRGWDGCVTTKKDFSSSDRMFAYNAGIKFQTPEEFFLEQPVLDASLWSCPCLQVTASENDLGLNRTTCASATDEPMPQFEQELVICVGAPASGKSTWVTQHFNEARTGYVYVNQDLAKTKAKCLRMVRDALIEGKSVIVDNTNPAAATRAEYTALVAKHAPGISTRCIWFDTTLVQCRQMNNYREMQTNGDRSRIPRIAFNMYASKFQEPSVEKEPALTSVHRITVTWHFPDASSREMMVAASVS